MWEENNGALSCCTSNYMLGFKDQHILHLLESSLQKTISLWWLIILLTICLEDLNMWVMSPSRFLPKISGSHRKKCEYSQCDMVDSFRKCLQKLPFQNQLKANLASISVQMETHTLTIANLQRKGISGVVGMQRLEGMRTIWIGSAASGELLLIFRGKQADAARGVREVMERDL